VPTAINLGYRLTGDSARRWRIELADGDDLPAQPQQNSLIDHSRDASNALIEWRITANVAVASALATDPWVPGSSTSIQHAGTGVP
jgi:hypothetical protein